MPCVVQGEFESAIQYFFRWGLVCHPNNPTVLLNYALVQQCIRRNYNLAERLYRRAIAVDPDNEAVHVNFVDFLEVRWLRSAWETRWAHTSLVGPQNRTDLGLYPDVGPSMQVVERSISAESYSDANGGRPPPPSRTAKRPRTDDFDSMRVALAPGSVWEPRYDPLMGRVFYRHKVTGNARWELQRTREAIMHEEALHEARAHHKSLLRRLADRVEEQMAEEVRAPWLRTL